MILTGVQLGVMSGETTSLIEAVRGFLLGRISVTVIRLPVNLR